jgi:TRAP-type C4-dicarboxylate transport system substrate-binding protein
MHSMIRTTLMVLALLPGPIVYAQTTIKIATVAPEGSSWVREMRAGSDAIKTATEGRVQFRYYPGGVMGSDAPAVLRKIKLGQLQGAALSSTEVAQVDPDAQILTLPFLFESEAEIQAVRKTIDPLLRASIESKGMAVLGLADGGFAYLMSTRPIRTKQELAATKVWAPQGDVVSIRTFEAGGVRPVTLPTADVYVALSTGLVETVGNSPSGAIIFQWHTRLKQMVDLPMTVLMGYLVVDGKAFAKISAADQQIVRDEMNRVFERIGENNRRDDLAAREVLVKQGIEIVSSTPAQRAEWVTVGRTAIDGLAKEGAFTPAMLKSVNDAIAAYRAAHGSTGATPAP